MNFNVRWTKGFTFSSGNYTHKDVHNSYSTAHILGHRALSYFQGNFTSFTLKLFSQSLWGPSTHAISSFVLFFPQAGLSNSVQCSFYIDMRFIILEWNYDVLNQNEQVWDRHRAVSILVFLCKFISCKFKVIFSVNKERNGCEFGGHGAHVCLKGLNTTLAQSIGAALNCFTFFFACSLSQPIWGSKPLKILQVL